MGEVYLADDTRLKRPVALKRLAPRLQSDKEYRDRFLREAQYASGLNYQNIASVYDVLEANNELFVVMEYVEGQTLRQRLAKPLCIEEFLDIAVQCAAALTAAHGRGIAHRDIKPENIMLSASGQVKILDFGVAKQLPHLDEAVTMESSAAEDSSSAGTPAYMAPEVLLEKAADHRADIFSLGVVGYEALTGRHPFRAAGVLGTSSRILHETPQPLRQLNPKIPAELERIVVKMVAKDPGERYASAADLLVDLRGVQRSFSHPGVLPAVPARGSASREAPRRGAAEPAPRNRKYAVVGGILLLLAVIAVVAQKHFHWFRPVSAGPRNLAVLPFETMGGGPEDKAYTDGMTETLTSKLTQLTATHSDLQVVSAADVRARHITTADAARRELGVSLALIGSVHRSGNTVRVNCALVDTTTLRQLRADTITASVSDPFSLQDSVADGTVQMLALELKPQERQALQRHGTQVAGAYDLNLQGRGYLQNYDKPENIDSAITAFERALQLDPHYASAHAGLGEAYWKKYEGRKETPWVDRARAACQQALALEAKLPAAHTCLGKIEDGTGQPDHAVVEFRRALDAEPTSDDAYRALATSYEHLNRPAEAERTYKEAIRLRPQYWGGYSWLGAFYFRQARYPEAAEMFSRVVALVPDSFRGSYNLGAVYVYMGRYSDAIATLQRSVAIRPTAAAYSNMATAYFYQRRFEDAASTYEQALKLDAQNYVVWGNLGDAYSWTPAQRAEASRAYQKAVALVTERLKVNPNDAYLLSDLATYQAMLGDATPARNTLQIALAVAPAAPEVRFRAALVYTQLGDIAAALDWLDKALAAGYPAMKVRDTPNFDTLKSNPRFQELLREKSSK